MDLSWLNDALLIRMVSTGLVVILVSWSVGAFGPLVGGALAGLPMVLGPAFFFLSREASADFVAITATYSLISLCATQCFVLTYLAAARRLSAAAALALSVLAWMLTALLCRQLPPLPWLGLALFIALTGMALHASRHFAPPSAKSPGKAGWGTLLMRGTLAGMLVAAITTSSHWLGASSAGILLAFPIGYTVIATTIHQKMGAHQVIHTLRSALLGGCSLAAFCLALALLATRTPPWAALSLATCAAVLVTTALVLRNRRK